jgi:hypothetical protein
MPPRAAAPAPPADGQGYSHRSDGKKLAGWPPRLLAPKTLLATHAAPVGSPPRLLPASPRRRHPRRWQVDNRACLCGALNGSHFELGQREILRRRCRRRTWSWSDWQSRLTTPVPRRISPSWQRTPPGCGSSPRGLPARRRNPFLRLYPRRSAPIRTSAPSRLGGGESPAIEGACRAGALPTEISARRTHEPLKRPWQRGRGSRRSSPPGPIDP